MRGSLLVDLVRSAAGGEVVENHGNHDPGATDAWAPVADLRIDDDVFVPVQRSYMIPPPGWRLYLPWGDTRMLAVLERRLTLPSPRRLKAGDRIGSSWKPRLIPRYDEIFGGRE